MLPRSWCCLDALPLSPNGKVEPAASCRRPQSCAPRPGVAGAPRNPTEAGWWRSGGKLLGSSGSASTTTLFRSAAIPSSPPRPCPRVRQVFGVDLPLRTFSRADVAAVAGEVAGRAWRGRRRTCRRSSRCRGTGGSRSPSPRNGSGSSAGSIPGHWPTTSAAFAWRAGWTRPPSAFSWTKSCAVTRASAPPSPRWRAAGAEDRAPAPSRSRRSIHPAPAAVPKASPAAALGPGPSPLRPRPGPLVRGLLTRLDERPARPLFSSITSSSTVGRRRSSCAAVPLSNGARIAARPSPLPPLSLPVRRLRRLQRAWLQGEVLRTAARLLAGAARRHRRARPGDDPPPAILPRRPAAAARRRPAALDAALRAFSGARRHPVHDSPRGLPALLHRYSGQDDVAVGSPSQP